MIAAHVHSSKKTYIGLFYKSKESNTFNLKDVVWAEVQPGKNIVHLFFITEPHKTMDIRVHFGYDQSEYTILPMPEEIEHIQKMLDTNK